MDKGWLYGLMPVRPIPVRRSALRPALSPFLSCRLVDQEIIKFLSTFDRSNKPTWSCAPTRPSLTFRTAIFGFDLPALQRASTLRATSNRFAAKRGNPLQLLFHFDAMLAQSLINLVTQVHER